MRILPVDRAFGWLVECDGSDMGAITPIGTFWTVTVTLWCVSPSARFNRAFQELGIRIDILGIEYNGTQARWPQ